MPFQTTAQITSHLRKMLDEDYGREKSAEPPTKKARQSQRGFGDKEQTETTPRTLSPVPHAMTQNTPDDVNVDVDEEDGELADIEDNSEDNTERNDLDVPHPIYKRGKIVFEDDLYRVFVKAVRHKKVTRFSLSDHLFTVWVETKQLMNNEEPLLFDLEFALEKGLIEILDRLKAVYDSQYNQNQIYITILEKNMVNGLNSGNYSLHTPSKMIVRWVLSMLYHFLKSNQTIRLNESFKIQIKVLSFRHTQQLEKNKRGFIKHLYH